MGAKSLEENQNNNNDESSFFVRVDNAMENNYSPYRRAQRLSYVIPFLADSVVKLKDEKGNNRQELLEMELTEERLDAILKKLGIICNFLQKLLDGTKQEYT